MLRKRLASMYWSGAVSLLCACGAPADTAADVTSAAETTADNRKVVELPTQYPWNNAVKVYIGATGGGGGSGVLVAPCTILTNGHVVYSLANDDFRTIYSVVPAQYYDEANTRTLAPYGVGEAAGLATNTRYADGDGENYDYGAIFVAEPFDDGAITTFFPLEFDAKPTYVNESGYPIEDLPETGAGRGREQWWGHGQVNKIKSRRIYHEAQSTGGASGAPTWRFQADGSRRLVAINQGHDDDSPGIGVRLVGANEDLITSWVEQGDCSSRSQATKAVAAVSWSDLKLGRKDLSGRPIELRTATDLRLVPASKGRTFRVVESVSVVQHIEGTVYRWIENWNPETEQRYIELVAPERQVLSTEHATVLLSASRLFETSRAAPRMTPRSIPAELGTTPVVPEQKKTRSLRIGGAERELARSL